MTRAVIVVNPAAGGGRTTRIWRRLRDVVAATLPAEHVETRGPGDGERVAREAAAAGAALVVAVGGDGTLNEVVSGVRSTGTAACIGVVLTGRGCDAARNFGVPRDPVTAVRVLANGGDARFDLGRAEWADGRRRWFATSAGAGFDAAVARRAQSMRMRGTLSYLAAVVATVRRHAPAEALIEMDDARATPMSVTAVVAANGRWFGGGMKIAPAADPADGAFDVVVIGALGRLELLRWLPTIYTGRHLRHPRIAVQRARRVRITASRPLPTHVDGEPIGTTPILLAMEPGALRLRVPQSPSRGTA